MSTQCTSCLSFNESRASFCSQCGSPLGRGSARSRASFWALLILGAGLAVGWFFFDPPARDEVPPARNPGGTEVARSTGGGPTESASSEAEGIRRVEVSDGASGADAESRRWNLTVADVAVYDRWDQLYSRTSGFVVGGSWVAIPVRSCLAGTRLTFAGGTPDERDLTGVSWNPESPIVFWQTDTDVDWNTPEWSSWDGESRLVWISATTGSSRTVKVGTTDEVGDLLGFELPGIKEPGLILSEGAAVGWTFSQLPGRGWLWDGAAEPRASLTTDEFYFQTFADGCEEGYLEEYSLADRLSAGERLRILARACVREPRLEPDETPPPLALSSVRRRVGQLIQQLVRSEQGIEVLNAVGSRELIALQAPEILVALVDLRASVDGFETAILLMEDVREELQLDRANRESLDQLHRTLYSGWIQEGVASGRMQIAWRAWEGAREVFPEDADVHLTGVELHISDQAYDHARSLLQARAYTGDAQVRARRLEKILEDLEAGEGKIVVRFTPGSRSINSQATLNGRRRQPFIVDTGATTTTIPWEAVERLGISTEGAPRVRVTTASGEVNAPEVVLDSLDLQGAVVRGLRVIVLDLPGKSDTGLIGLDFLRNFRVDLRTDAGMLILEPR